LICGRNSAVECQLPKLKVAGSNPVARSNTTKIKAILFCKFAIALWLFLR
jgi:hypothetical protein